MRYVFILEAKDPVIENWQKIGKLAEERTAKGIGIGEPTVLGWHFDGRRMFCVTDIDGEYKVAKWVADFTPFAKAEAIPIVEGMEYHKRYL